MLHYVLNIYSGFDVNVSLHFSVCLLSFTLFHFVSFPNYFF